MSIQTDVRFSSWNYDDSRKGKERKTKKGGKNGNDAGNLNGNRDLRGNTDGSRFDGYGWIPGCDTQEIPGKGKGRESSRNRESHSLRQKREKVNAR